MLQVLVSGLQVGSSYSLMALALVLVLKATDVPNFAQAEMGLLAVFVVWVGMNQLDLNYWFSVVLGLVAAVVLALVLERLLIRPIAGGTHFTSIFMTIGIFFTVNSVIALVWDSVPRSLDSPFTGTLRLGDAVVSKLSLVAIATGILVAIALEIFFRSRMGVQMRAVAENAELPRLLGVKLGHVFAIAWGMAACIACIAVLLTAQANILNDQAAQTLILTGFVAATFGGFSSISGAMLGGLFLGVVENLAGTYISTAAASATSLLVVVGVLLLKPEGVLGEMRSREI